MLSPHLLTGRRDLVALLAAHAVSAPLFAGAQSAAKVSRVALVNLSASLADMKGPSSADEFTRGVVRRLRELGYEEGRNISIERRSAEGDIRRLPVLMKELVDLRVDVIVTLGPGAAEAQRATSTIPIVAWVDDPIGGGLTSRLNRPTKNITGVIIHHGLELIGKKLQLLKQMAPKSRRVALIDYKYVDARVTPGAHQRRLVAQAAARDLGMTLIPVGINDPEDFEQAFAVINTERADSILDIGTPVTWIHRHRIIDFAAQRRLPAIYPSSRCPLEGGLMSYGEGLFAVERLAEYVDKLLKGAKPADLPFDQPKTFELVINSKTAALLDLTIPRSLLLVAEVVDTDARR